MPFYVSPPNDPGLDLAVNGPALGRRGIALLNAWPSESVLNAQGIETHSSLFTLPVLNGDLINTNKGDFIRYISTVADPSQGVVQRQVTAVDVGAAKLQAVPDSGDPFGPVSEPPAQPTDVPDLPPAAIQEVPTDSVAPVATDVPPEGTGFTPAPDDSSPASVDVGSDVSIPVSEVDDQAAIDQVNAAADAILQALEDLIRALGDIAAAESI